MFHPGIVCSLVSFLVYMNTFHADFVYDDRRAILQNRDVTLSTPLASLLFRDYWGSPLNHTGSHGSYRPFTVLTFRLNYYFFDLQPSPYHVTNVILHCIATYLFCAVLSILLHINAKKTYAAGLLFAVHPIHTEAVAGVVGRADVLATIFCLLTLLTYKKSCDNRVFFRCPTKEARSNKEARHSINKVQTLSHNKYPKPVKKKSKRMANKKNNFSKTTAFQQNRAANFAHVLRYKQKLFEGKEQDSGSLSDHSHSTTDTVESHVSSSNSLCFKLSLNDESDIFHSIDTHWNSKQTDTNVIEPKSNSNILNNATLNPFDSRHISYSQKNCGHNSSQLSKISITKFWWFIACLLCSVFAILSKEIGYCALPLCILYDLCLRQKILEKLGSLTSNKQKFRFGRVWVVFSFWIGLVAFRVGLPMSLSGKTAAFPKFSTSDNPAAACDNFLTRALTFNYLLACHVQMLFFPISLSFDWSMDAIPLIASVFDLRNVTTVVMYALAAVLLKYLIISAFSKTLRRKDDEKLAGNLDCFTGQDTKIRPIVRRLSSTSSEESLNEWTLDKNQNITKARKSNKPKIWKPKRGLSDVLTSRSPSEEPNGSDIMLFACSVLVLSLLPATNLFFYVGFVLAERLLYLPSVGSCILIVEMVAVITEKLKKIQKSSTANQYYCRESRNFKQRHVSTLRQFVASNMWLFVLLCYFCARTFTRNQDWKNEMTLYKSGLTTNSAKAFANLGNSLRSEHKLAEAEDAYKQALEQRPNMADAHYNLGLIYQETSRHKKAEERYRLAIRFRPGMAVAHLNLGVVMAEQHQKEAAKTIYRHAATLENSDTKDPVTHTNAQISALFNLGCLLADDGDYRNAIAVFEEAVKKSLDNYKPHSLYNMLGQCFFHLHEYEDAERWFNASLTSKPDHAPAHLTYASLLALKGLADDAVRWYSKALSLEPQNKEIYKHYSNFLIDAGQYVNAAVLLTQAINSSFGKNDYDLISSAASAYRQATLYDKAEEYYKKAVKLKPNLASAHLNLGAIFHLQEKYDAARISYMRALELQPDNRMILDNLNKLQLSINN